MERNKSYYRFQRRRHIARKKRIIKYSLGGYWCCCDGYLSKGKIHCSCWMCRTKTYDHKSASDLRKIEKLNFSERDNI